MTRPAVSVIIPAYNLENHIERCLQGIINQQFTDWEIILINDGSSDRTKTICEIYEKRDSRIKLINQRNQGVVAARNNGIRHASGTFLAFIDGDDWIDENFLSSMVKSGLETNSDIIWCDWKEVYENSNPIKIDTAFEKNPIRMINNIISDKSKGYLWNKLIRTSFYKRCNILTDSDCCMMEDMLVSIQLLIHRPNMSYVHDYMYNYYQRDNSLTNSIFSNPLIKGKSNIELLYKVIRMHNIKELINPVHTLAMKSKIAIINEQGLDSAKAFIPSAHKNIFIYPLKGVYPFLYWCFFNLGHIGNLFYNLYFQNFKKLN